MNAFERDYDPRFRYHRDWPHIEERRQMRLLDLLVLVALVAASWLIVSGIAYAIWRWFR